MDNYLMLSFLFLLLSNVDGLALCHLASRTEQVLYSQNESNTCSIKQQLPVLHLLWHESSLNISEITELHGNPTKNRQLHVVQHSNSYELLRSSALVETIIHSNGYELNYNGTLFRRRIQIAMKTFQTEEELSSKIIFSNAEYKALLNISITPNQIWFNISKGDKHYRMSAAKTGSDWNFGFRSPLSTEDVIKGSLITSSSILQGTVHINLPKAVNRTESESQLAQWSGEVMLECLSNSGRISVSFRKNTTVFDAAWSNNDTTYQLTSQVAQSYSEPLLQLGLNSSFINSIWHLDMDTASPFFNWRWITNLTKSGQSNQRLIELTSRANYFNRPIIQPITYRFGYKESNQSHLLDLRHNITSELYHFESNLTIDCHPKGEIVTMIHQKAASSLSQLFYLELKQIFHQMATSFWETVVMKTGLVDMHVTGSWEQSIFHFYRKQFVFHSLIEDLLPSTTINLRYSDSHEFLHEILFPFLARKLVLLVDWQDSFQRLSLSDQNLFLSNETTNILEMLMFRREQCQVVKLVSDAKFEDFLSQITNHLRKIHKHLLSICANDHHPLNQLLKPLLGKSTICQFLNDIPLSIHLLFPEISLAYNSIHF